MKSFETFLESNTEKKYVVIDIISREEKSYNWVLLLLLRYGPLFLKDKYYPPSKVIKVPSTRNWREKVVLNAGLDTHFLFCDDFSFSGTQMVQSVNKLTQLLRERYPAAVDAYGNFNKTANINIVCAGCSKAAYDKFVNFQYKVHATKVFAPITPPLPDKILESLPQPFEDTIDYKNNIPLYFEHKLPDAMSSFPMIYKEIINNCAWDEETRIVDGSSVTTLCAQPFFKTDNIEKGKRDANIEKAFISKCINAYKTLGVSRKCANTMVKVPKVLRNHYKIPSNIKADNVVDWMCKKYKKGELAAFAHVKPNTYMTKAQLVCRLLA